MQIRDYVKNYFVNLEVSTDNNIMTIKFAGGKSQRDRRDNNK